jgi:hypothetical protein
MKENFLVIIYKFTRTSSFSCIMVLFIDLPVPSQQAFILPCTVISGNVNLHLAWKKCTLIVPGITGPVFNYKKTK